MHVIVVTPKLIDPIRDARRRLDVRASFMGGPTSVVAHTHYPEKTNNFLLKSGLFVPISSKWKQRRSGRDLRGLRWGVSPARSGRQPLMKLTTWPAASQDWGRANRSIRPRSMHPGRSQRRLQPREVHRQARASSRADSAAKRRATGLAAAPAVSSSVSQRVSTRSTGVRRNRAASSTVPTKPTSWLASSAERRKCRRRQAGPGSAGR